MLFIRPNYYIYSDRPKYGLVPVPATISTETEIPVPVSDIFRFRLEIWFKMLPKIDIIKLYLVLLRCCHFDKNNLYHFFKN